MLPWAGACVNIVAHPLKQIMSLESTGSKTAFSYSSHVFLVPKLSLVYGKTNIHICTLDVNNSCLGFQSNFPTFLPCCLTLTFQANSLFDRSLHHKFSGEGSDLASGWFSNVQVVVACLYNNMYDRCFLIHILESSFPIRLFYDIIFPGFYSLLRMYQKLRVLHSWRVADSILALERSQILYMHIGIYYF